MARIPQETINLIREKVDIVEVISHYRPVTGKDDTYKCVCPFHDDHDPSLRISKDKKVYHCFVCGAGGNTFDFIKNYEKVSFVEAVAKVAEIGGIDVNININEYKESSTTSKYAPLYKVLKEAIEYCFYEINSIESKEVKQYLYDRGLNDDIISRFQIGYNPKNNKLYNFLHAKKYKDEHILNVNLAWQTQNGIVDVFSHRIMIPIHDSNGNPVGFTARRVDPNTNAKYINTSDTEIYNKGNLLFNLHRAKNLARKGGKIIVVEGAMDVIAFAKADIHHVVATLGTAVTKQQLKLLKQLGCSVNLCYDGDKAGLNATYKFYKLAQSENINVEIINNKYGLDPDEIIEQHGKEALVNMSKKTVSWIDFLFDYYKDKYDLDNYSEKKQFAITMAEEIASLENVFEKDSYYTRLKQITGFNMHTEQKIPVKKVSKKTKEKQIVHQPKSGLLNAQYQILSMMLLSIQACELYRNELGFMLDEQCNSLALYILDYYREYEKMNIAKLIDEIKEDFIKSRLLSIVNWELSPQSYEENIMIDAISKMKECMLEEKVRTLKDKMNTISDGVEKAKIAKEIFDIRRKQGGNRNDKKD